MGWAKYTEDNYNMIEQRPVLYRRDAFIMPTVSVHEPSESRGIFPAHVNSNPKELKHQTSAIEPIKAQSQARTNIPKRDYIDRILRCKSCGHDFRFSAKQQEKYEKKGWQPPKRCWDCRNQDLGKWYAKQGRTLLAAGL